MQFTNFEDTKRFTSFRGSVPRQFREDHAHQRGYVPTFGSDIVCGVKYPPRRRESGGAQQRRAPGERREPAALPLLAANHTALTLAPLAQDEPL